jgi:hypothetical protein
MTSTTRAALERLIETWRKEAADLRELLADEHADADPFRDEWAAREREIDSKADELAALLALPAETPAPTRQTLECPCCGCEGVTANDAGEFVDGTPLECGCPGWVSVSEDDGAWINNGDLPCVNTPPPSREALAARLRELLTNDVIRATKALAQQRNVCREQGGQVVFVTGVEAAREYLIESLDALCPQEPT